MHAKSYFEIAGSSSDACRSAEVVPMLVLSPRSQLGSMNANGAAMDQTLGFEVLLGVRRTSQPSRGSDINC